MSAFQERIKGFRELPSLKSQIEEQKLKLESLEKIKNNVSSENYLSLSGSYEKTISGLTPRIDQLQSGIVLLKSDIEVDSKVLESENSIVEKELQELQFLSQRGALSKQDYDTKRNTLQQKISRNRSNLSKNQSDSKELEFYATYVGTDNYLKHIYKEQTGSLKMQIESISPKVWLSIGILIVLIIASMILNKPVRAIVLERIAWNKAVKENSYESYGVFIDQLPNSKRIISAKSKQEEALWQKVQKENSLPTVENYINLYQTGNHINEANLLKESLIWETISQSGKLTEYVRYLNLYPNGKFLSQALTKITELSIASSFTDFRDNRAYKTAEIGNQVWMAENLAYKSPTGCWAYANNENNIATYGYLYDWATAKNVCPLGWHLPSDTEWKVLIDYLGGESVAGGKMKESGTTHWESPNLGATNESAFWALPSGIRCPVCVEGEFVMLGFRLCLGGHPHEINYNESMNKVLLNKESKLLNEPGVKSYGSSVRCLKD